MRNFVERLLLEGVVSHLERPALDVAYARTRRLARIGRKVLRREWGWALRNLELVFGPDLPPRARCRLATLAFEQHFYSYMEGIRRADIDVTIEGSEHLQRSLDRGKGAVGVGLHLGSWEMIAPAVAREGIAASLVFRPTDNPHAERMSAAVRADPGTEWIPKADVWSMRRALARERLLLMLVDLNMTHGGIEVPFLGAPAMSPSGPARLALRSGTPIVPYITLRTGIGSATVRFCDALDPADSVSADDAVWHFTRRVHEVFEPWIVEHAEQHNWLHPRWRSRAGGGAWTLAQPIESLWKERVEPFARLPERVLRLLSAPS